MEEKKRNILRGLKVITIINMMAWVGVFFYDVYQTTLDHSHEMFPGGVVILSLSVVANVMIESKNQAYSVKNEERSEPNKILVALALFLTISGVITGIYFFYR